MHYFHYRFGINVEQSTSPPFLGQKGTFVMSSRSFGATFDFYMKWLAVFFYLL